MANLLNTFLKQIIQGDTVKDWDHASKLFVANSYNLVPKQTFLYHVFFDLNPMAVSVTQQKQIELGMLVKQVSLPKYKIDTKTLNAYNRPNIVQTKVHYDPVSVTFHDDSADIVRNFWFDYYAYYYRNSDYGSANDLSTYTNIHDELTKARQYKDWGYTIRGTTTGHLKKDPYLTSIRIYSLSNKKFSEYILINPFITGFQHGDHNSSEGGSVMQHQMMIEYESVRYAYGSVTNNTVHGFADLHYDKRPSPLTPAGGGTQSILGPGGIVQSADEIIKDVASGNFGAALFKGARVTNGLKGANVKGMAVAEAITLGRSVLGGNNPFGTVAIPTVKTSTNADFTSTAPATQATTNPIVAIGNQLFSAKTNMPANLPQASTTDPTVRSLDSNPI